MNKTIDIQKAVDMIKDGDTIMIGGFLAVGAPLKLIDAMVKKGLKDLTLITNDSAFTFTMTAVPGTPQIQNLIRYV
ncbi:MAG: hypothetical protein GX829_06675 [Clostridium sp.]|nr:hypothetical protein [Clostridium sp.]